MNTTLVINPKGGTGKTTLAINLASHFAATNTATAIMDYDPQGSSLHWLRSRAPEAARIHGANAAPPKPGRLRSFEMYVPPEPRQPGLEFSRWTSLCQSPNASNLCRSSNGWTASKRQATSAQRGSTSWGAPA